MFKYISNQMQSNQQRDVTNLALRLAKIRQQHNAKQWHYIETFPPNSGINYQY